MNDHGTQKLWVTDEELIALSGVPRRKMQIVLQAMDASPVSGFPKKNPLYDNRRFLPSVVEYWKGINPIAQRKAS